MSAQIMTLPTARRLIDRAESEKAFQQRVIDLAKACGWMVYHTFNSQKSKEGYPDLTLVKAGQPPIWAELKSERGRLSKPQAGWINQLRAAGGRVYVWRPSSWAEIQEVLMPRREKKGRVA